MKTEEIKSKLARANRVLNGDSEYDGADAARVIRDLCEAWLSSREGLSEVREFISSLTDDDTSFEKRERMLNALNG